MQRKGTAHTDMFSLSGQPTYTVTDSLVTEREIVVVLQFRQIKLFVQISLNILHDIF